MKLNDARDQAIRLIRRDLGEAGRLDAFDLASPDGDRGKFLLAGHPARLVVQRDGYYLNISLEWFKGSTDMASISGGPIFWYVFVIPPPDERYFICSHHKMRRWVLDFAAKGDQPPRPRQVALRHPPHRQLRRRAVPLG